jgi:hypothetical protein
MTTPKIYTSDQLDIQLFQRYPGWTDHRSGFSGNFSWWRLPNGYRAQFCVIGHVEHFANRHDHAVVNDFSDLVPLSLEFNDARA